MATNRLLLSTIPITEESTCLTLDLSDRNRCNGCTRFQSTLSHATGKRRKRIKIDKCAKQWIKGRKNLKPSKKMKFMSTWEELEELGYTLSNQYKRAKSLQEAPSRKVEATPPKRLHMKRVDLFSTIKKTIKRMRKTEPPSPESNIIASPEIARLESRNIDFSQHSERKSIDFLPGLEKELEDEDDVFYDSLISDISSPTKKKTSSKSETNFVMIQQCEYDKLNADSFQYNTILSSNILIGKQFGSSFEGRAMLAQEFAFSPQQSLETREMSLALTTNYLLHELGIDVSPEQIARTSPSTSTIREIIKDGATNALYLFRARILSQPDIHMFLLSDKGGGRLIKRLARYNPLRGEVEVFTLDTDGSEDSSYECANGVEFSMRRLQGGTINEIYLKKLSLYGSITDSGGGGTGFSFKEELTSRKDLTCENEEFLIGFCCMHILQITFCNPMKALMGEGGLEKRNCLQLLHSLYDFEEKFERGEFLQYVEEARKALGIATTTIWKRIQAPILTRWGTVGLAASFVCDENIMRTYQLIAQWAVNKFPSSNACNKIASSILSLMKEPLILSDSNLLNGFMTYYFNESYAWFETGDPALGGTLGFLSRHMLLRYFIMSKKLKDAMDGGWEKMIEFEVFAKFINLTDDQKKFQYEKADQFMNLAYVSIKKKFLHLVQRSSILWIIWGKPNGKNTSKIFIWDE